MRKSLLALTLAMSMLIGCTPTTMNSSQVSSETNIDEDIFSAVVSTAQGKLQGQRYNGISRFLGVPYAEVKERFTRAQALSAWDGIRTATSFGPRAPQGTIPGLALQDKQDNTSENCTTLNIWTPKTGDQKKRPVMVWLHGGGFSSGSSNEPLYDGADLSAKGDVVVVSVNHRLNALGFLDLSAYGDKYKDSANLGIWDIIDALTWVKQNIEAFGGDPENVTLFGQSGGGAKGLALMSSPYAKGLFSKVIVQSGATETMGVRFASKKAGARLAEHVFENLDLKKGDMAKLSQISIDKLEAAATKALAQTGEDFKIPAALGKSYSMDFVPEVDGDFLPTDPVTADGFAEAAKDVSLLIGSNLNEWSGYFPQEKIEETPEIKKALREAYPDKKDLSADMVDNYLIRQPLMKIMSHKARQNGAKVYAYVFTYGRSNHGAELPYIFNHAHDTPDHQELSDMMSSAWINFAKNGNPSAQGMPTWEPFTEEGGATMLLDIKPTLRHHHDRELLKLLNPSYRLYEGDKVVSADRLNFPLGNKVVAERFSGPIYMQNLIKKGDVPNFKVANSIVFEPGVHSSWHRHGGMIIMATGGEGYYQEEGKKAQVLHPGDIVEIKEGVKHWHGASADSWFSQIVIYDSDYNAQPEPLEFADYNILEVEDHSNKGTHELGMTFETGAEPFQSSNFTGRVFVSSLIEAVNVAKTPALHYVAFDQGVVNKWHSHEGGQLLIVTDGEGFHQMPGQKAKLLHPGDVAFCPPGVKHWHGAAKGQVFGHIAAAVDPAHTKVQWFDFPKIR